MQWDSMRTTANARVQVFDDSNAMCVPYINNLESNITWRHAIAQPSAMQNTLDAYLSQLDRLVSRRE